MELLSTGTTGDATAPYARTAEPSTIGVATTNADGEILAVSDAFVAMLHSRSGDLIGKRLHMHAPLHQRMQQGYLTADGEEVWMTVTATSTFGPGHVIEQIVWLFEPCDFEGQRRQADRLATLERLVSTTAHDFNNVLMGISPFIEVIRRGKSIEISLDQISRAVKRGKRLTEEIVRLTRPENTALEARPLVPPS